MKKTTAVLTAITLSLGTLLSGGVANASSQEVSGVSAYYRVDLGYKVGWQAPANTSGITRYIVTAEPSGKTCLASSRATECTFKTRDLGYTEQYTFTVQTVTRGGVVATSTPSNPVSAASIPVSPLAVTTNVVSDSQIDVAWIPSAVTGGAPLYGYEVSYWKSDRRGNPITNTKVSTVATQTYTTLTVEPGYMYIVNVASCNAYGCNSAQYWSYANTGATNVTLPRVISGGTASTTCFESIYDANAGESEVATCGPIVADPSTYPIVDPSATELNIQLATKFRQTASLRFNRSYSLRTWGPIGISWFTNLQATSKSVAKGFEAAPVVSSSTPSVCLVDGPKIVLISTGTCTIEAYVEGNGVFNQSNVAVARFAVTN